jgi:osmotically-inducible protein OsmY
MKTDMQLQEDVLAELKWDPAVDETAIGMVVSEGIVTLTGHVDTYPQRWSAEKAVQRVAGVKGLAVEIQVKIDGSRRRSDTEIAQAARHALDWNSSLPKGAVQLIVRDGWITLSGEVGWAYLREAAENSVHGLIGVVGVTNELRIKSHVEARDVKRKIVAAFHRQAQVDARKVAVRVEGAEVTLSGSVDTWAEKAAARDAAWAAPGVWSVVDHMTVGN